MKKSFFRTAVLFLLLVSLTACAAPQPSISSAEQPTSSPIPSATLALPTATATPALPAATLAPGVTPSATPTPIPPTPTLAADAWKEMPVIPTLSDTARSIYQRGQALGNNPNAFSKVGDCESIDPYFLGDFDQGPRFYNLGEYTSLQPVIDTFAGSFGRKSFAVKLGTNAGAVLSPLWNDWKECTSTESPLECEYRIQKPAFAFISLGTNDAYEPEKFETNLRKVIERTIELGIVPILSTKADNLEGNHAINQTIARLAYEYDIPLWNFWRAVQKIPEAGRRDAVHLSYSEIYRYTEFQSAENLQYGWPVRNLTAMQVLEAVWRGVTETVQK